MSEEKIRSYISEALKRHYPVEEVMTNLIKVGHNEESVRKLTKEAIQQRIGELESKKSGLSPF